MAKPRKKGYSKFFDFYLQEINFIYAFWAMFWLLNGLDKFFIRVGAEPGQECFFADGRRTMCGWFGTDRTAQFEGYFGKLFLPDWVAFTALYSITALQLLLGGLFVWMLIKNVSAREPVSHFIHRLAFKGSLLIFFLFMMGDILFGDRMELWEHGTFMILVIITFGLYVYRDQLRTQVIRDLEPTISEAVAHNVGKTMMYRQQFEQPGDEPEGDDRS